MSVELIDRIARLSLNVEYQKSVKDLLSILSNDWVKGLTALKKSRILVNQFGNKEYGTIIDKVIRLLTNSVPRNYKSRYNKYFLSIIPLNTCLSMISEFMRNSAFWRTSREQWTVSLLARFEIVYAHITANMNTYISDRLLTKDIIDLSMPIMVKTQDGTYADVDTKLQQLAASLDRNLRFIEYLLKQVPIVISADSYEVYKAGTFQLTGEAWNSILYFTDKVSLFSWYATKISDKPETFLYQPKNSPQQLYEKVGELRESQWLKQLFMEAEGAYGAIKEHVTQDDALAPRNEEELRAYVELSGMCHDKKILDVKFKNGLMVKEYIKSWFVIKEVAK